MLDQAPTRLGPHQCEPAGQPIRSVPCRLRPEIAARQRARRGPCRVGHGPLLEPLVRCHWARWPCNQLVRTRHLQPHRWLHPTTGRGRPRSIRVSPTRLPVALRRVHGPAGAGPGTPERVQRARTPVDLLSRSPPIPRSAPLPVRALRSPPGPILDCRARRRVPKWPARRIPHLRG